MVRLQVVFIIFLHFYIQILCKTYFYNQSKSFTYNVTDILVTVIAQQQSYILQKIETNINNNSGYKIVSSIVDKGHLG